jgi:hypothetical protein
MPFTNLTDIEEMTRTLQQTEFRPKFYHHVGWLGKWAIFHNDQIVEYSERFVFDSAAACRTRLRTFIKNTALRMNSHWNYSANSALCQNVTINGFVFTLREPVNTGYLLDTFDPQLLTRLTDLFVIRQVTQQDIENYLNRLRTSLMSNNL